jgi:hypothetical protein
MPRTQIYAKFGKDDARAVMCKCNVEKLCSTLSIESSLKLYHVKMAELNKFFKQMQIECIMKELEITPNFCALTRQQINVLAAQWGSEIRDHLISLKLCSESAATGFSSNGKKKNSKKNTLKSAAIVDSFVPRPKWLTQDGEAIFEYGETLERFRERFKKAFLAIKERHEVSSAKIVKCHIAAAIMSSLYAAYFDL